MKVSQVLTFTELMRLFRDRQSLVDVLGCNYQTVASWELRNSVPPARFGEIVAAATTLKVRGVTYETLAAARSLAVQESRATGRQRGRKPKPS